MLKIVHLELAEANALVDELHRHHKPVRGHRFSVGAVDTKSGKLVGAAIVGRPVARAVNYKTALEVTRLVTDGKPRRTDQPTQKKQRWSKSLNACLPNNACTNDPASPRETAAPNANNLSNQHAPQAETPGV